MALRELLSSQQGVITEEQAVGAGLSARAVRRRVARNEWVRVAPRTYRAVDHPETDHNRVRAAVLSLGPDAVLVGPAAVWWWRLLDHAPVEVAVALPLGRRPTVRDGVRVRQLTVDPDDVVVVDGIRVTKRAVSVLAAASELGLTDGARLLDRVLLRGVVGIDELREVHVRTAPRWGSRLATTLLSLAAGGARSQAERVAVRTLRVENITGWVANLECTLPGYGPVVLDLAFRELRIVVEIDGWAYHRDLRAFLRDARRQNALVVDGWAVIRTNWYELRASPATFTAALRATIARRSRAAA